jgi:protein gp37
VGTNTKIAWTATVNPDGSVTPGHTWNPWQGCQKISAGCEHCYMYRDKKRYGQDGGKVVVSSKATFGLPLRLKGPARVFVCSWSDFFIDSPVIVDARRIAWGLMRTMDHLTFQLLTKRPENIAAMLPPDWGNGYPNVWLGVTAENQEMANKRIPILLQTPAAKRFVSVEPMLGPVDLSRVTLSNGATCHPLRVQEGRYPVSGNVGPVSWVIVGGESGPGARPMNPDWAQSLRDQCKTASVPFFFKQQGEWALMGADNAAGRHYVITVDGDLMIKVGRAAAGDRLDGVEHKQFPAEV